MISETPNRVDQDVAASAIAIVRLLEGYQFDLSTEKHLQADVAETLTASGIVFEREKRLNASDIPDFLVAGGIVVECKLKNRSRKMEVYKQLLRYAVHRDVTAIVLASNAVMGLPAEMEGKPVYSVSFSKAWL